MRFLDQQPFYHQQSALQINFQQQQQQFDTQTRHLDEQQKLLQDNHLYQHQHQHQPVAQGYIDEGGNLCIIEYPETVDEAAAGATNSAKSSAKQYSRHSTREKTKSSQKRRKKRKARQQQTQQLSKDLGRLCFPSFQYKTNFIAINRG